MANTVFPKVQHDWLKHEGDMAFGRRAGTIKSGAGVVGTGTVLGKIPSGTATAAAVAGGTGNGTITMDATTPILPGAKAGVWRATCITAALNGGTFRVEDPDGAVRGDVAVGGTFADGVKFVIADGLTDFVVGDAFTVTVHSLSAKYVPISFAATDGSQNAAAILIDGCDATSADVESAILIKDAQIVSSQLTWPSGATSAQKAVALGQLADLGIEDLQRL